MSITHNTGWILVLILIVFLAFIMAYDILKMLRGMRREPDRTLKAILLLTPLAMIFLYLFILRPVFYGFLVGFYDACPELPNIDIYVDLTLSVLVISVFIIIWQEGYIKMFRK
jgi:CDP-diglyceride synthetase